MNIAVKQFDEVGSTNQLAMQMAKEGAPEGTLVLAECQKSGRGRRGRSWDSPAGVNLFMSLILRPQVAIDQASMITLLMALGCAEAVNSVTNLECKIKWPNDLVCSGRKLCGILTELYPESDQGYFVICGVGINVNQEAFAPEIRETATSLYLESGKQIERQTLMKLAMERFDFYYQEFQQTGSLQFCKRQYEQYLVNKDRQVRVLDPRGDFEGTAIGIDEKGQLLVQRKDQSVTAVYAGEVSVRGLYGYV